MIFPGEWGMMGGENPPGSGGWKERKIFEGKRRMLQISILGINLYHILAWFFVYSFLGWVWESCYVSVKERKWVNRGFVAGPVVTLYGVGAVTVYVILRPLSGHVLALYLGGVVLATALEYVTGKLMEAIFHTSWWDYSHKRFNFQGVICLGSSLAWGFFTLGLFYGLHPVVSRLVDLVPVNIGAPLIWLSLLLYLLDFSVSMVQAARLSGKLRSLDKAWEDFLDYVQGSRLAESAADFREWLGAYRRETSRKKAIRYLAEYKDKVKGYISRFGDANQDLQSAFWEKYDSFMKVAQEKKSSLSRTHKRLLRAYPNLSIRVRRKDKKQKTQETEETK